VQGSIDSPSSANRKALSVPSASAAEESPGASIESPLVASGVPAAREAEGVESPTAMPPSADALDFTSLVKRLRKTKAINLVTKVAVKNQSDDLLDEFRAYHMRHGTATLADLRRHYDSLFSRLHLLLQDADPPLARDIDRSRAALWEILTDPSKFAASHLMAGA
jgi:hypothetical protein